MPNNQETIKGCITLALYIGLVYAEPNASYNKGQFWKKDNNDGRKKKFVSYFDQLEYHENWSWFMPVYFKFKDEIFATETQFDCHSNLVDSVSLAITDTCHDSPLPAFNELVKGIEWYNSLNK